jgi:uncharacterized protein YycO
VRIAFYKGTRPGIAGIYNRVVRWWCGGKYSHVELVFSDGIAASASFEDGGVRMKRIDLDPGKWDIVEVSPDLALGAIKWFMDNAGKPYDLLGNVGFLWRPIQGDRDAYFCSEAIAAALGIPEPWRLDPCALHALLTSPLNPAHVAGFSFGGNE